MMRKYQGLTPKKLAACIWCEQLIYIVEQGVSGVSEGSKRSRTITQIAECRGMGMREKEREREQQPAGS